MRFFYSIFFILIFSINSFAHFQVILPSTDVVSKRTEAALFIQYLFTHPFEQGPIMEMKRPVEAAVQVRGKKQIITDQLVAKQQNGKTTWEMTFPVKQPGDHFFTLVPELYFEPAEGVFIQHITKVIVNAYGMEDAWDQPVGLKAEIVPLTRPYGVWVGQIFSGIVMYKGKPVPHAEIEMEYYNKGSKIKAPNSSFITQVLKADQNGVFHSTLPITGWWAFAALIEDDYTVMKAGKQYPVELGAVFWVKATALTK